MSMIQNMIHTFCSGGGPLGGRGCQGLGVDGQQLFVLQGKVHRDDGLCGQHLWLQLHELLQWTKVRERGDYYY